ncbi:hypothetical protein BS78_10G268500 [Paspalum vaginatum]|nr:hypothetical protein BS78_10G268500 [Paspalum vaginatum]
MSGRRITALLLLAVAAALCCFYGDAVADSCDAIRDFVDVGFCASRLRSVPGAATEDRHSHLLMAADLAAASGASARDAAAGMMERDGAVDACGMLYGAASEPARLRGGALLPLTGQAGIGCDAALAGSEAAANRAFDQLSTMTTALLNKQVT